MMKFEHSQKADHRSTGGSGGEPYHFGRGPAPARKASRTIPLEGGEGTERRRNIYACIKLFCFDYIF